MSVCRSQEAVEDYIVWRPPLIVRLVGSVLAEPHVCDRRAQARDWGTNANRRRACAREPLLDSHRFKGGGSITGSRPRKPCVSTGRQARDPGEGALPKASSLEVVCNLRRAHSSLGYRSPLEYEDAPET